MLRRQLSSTNALFTFEVVARLGSFSKAAKELNVTQPAITRAISGFETHLGYQLFDRHGRWIKLTSNGHKLYRATSTAFKTVIDTLQEINQQEENRDDVTISMSPAAVNYWFIPRLKNFKKIFPTVKLGFQMHSDDGDNLTQGIDLCIRLSYPKDTNLHRWDFADEQIMALCSLDYIREHGTLESPAKGRTHTLIEFTNSRYSMDEFFHAIGQKPLKDPTIMKFSDYSNIIQAAIGGQGIALAWVPETSRLIIKGQLVPIFPQVIKTGRRYHILASNLTPMRPIVENIRDWLIGEMRSDHTKVTSMMRANAKLMRTGIVK
ncbi:MAG: LysR family transcriptional regulator [Proteobacteria bacterium]|nr:LysR family transcriptional regulator [Pseudomonadota bacterium]